ncbi:MAG: hypothetical protein M3512_03650 [Bacteroidota bacterium]|nr:hypothetical protein [Bacteroidota bacterium]
MKIVAYIKLLLIILTFSCQPNEKKNEQELAGRETIGEDTLKKIIDKWEGAWEREGSIDPATLKISNVTLSSFDFQLAAHDGINDGEFSGKATLEAAMALYISINGTDTCQLNFILQDSLVVISQAKAGCSETSGIDFSGEYFEDRYFQDKVMEEEAK